MGHKDRKKEGKKDMGLEQHEGEEMTEMNEWCIYIIIVYCWTPKPLYNHVGGGGVSPQPPPVCSIHLDDETAATGQRHQCAHHTPATGGEERES